MEKRRSEITIRVVDPTSRQLESVSFVWSGVIMVGVERLARVTHDDSGTQYELFKIPDATAKWARVKRTAEGTLTGAFASLDEFAGMLWADAMEEPFCPDPEHPRPPERHLSSLKCVSISWVSLRRGPASSAKTRASAFVSSFSDFNCAREKRRREKRIGVRTELLKDSSRFTGSFERNQDGDRAGEGELPTDQAQTTVNGSAAC